ncbi:MAG: SUMF1/EgtB/PvdO family nonheme iron enzyme, partial [Opitutae bacterium]|nr:SUMF1/EgtB/PvdO family nonheme iron enzyme [Opitutae bacterium]
MKKLLAAMFVALLMVGCGEDDTATSAPEPSREPSPAPVNLSTSAVEGKPFAIADLSMDMLWVKPGTFEMGSPPEEEDLRDNATQHTVTLTEGYWLGKQPVTQTQWEKVMGDNPSRFEGADRPVEYVTWTDVTS